MKRLRILISSHEFSPAQGSECAVGWNIVTRIAKLHDVTLLCADGPPLYPNSYRNAVNHYIEKNGLIPGLEIVYVEQPSQTLRYARLNRRLMRLTKGIGWQILYYMGLDYWHRAVLQKAKERGADNFDAVHQLTPISFLRPGYLWTMEVPFFWGPVGGMFRVPVSFSKLGGTKSFLFETLRSMNISRLVRSGQLKRMVFKASRIWTITNDERRIVESIGPGKAAPMVDTAPPADIAGHVRRYDGQRPLRICWSGSHVVRKSLPLLLHALAGFNERGKVMLDVLGEGPQTRAWKDLATSLNVTCVKWHGRLPYQQALMTMGKADVFVHTSFREAASMVVLEAMGWGMPIICHDACGMAVVVDGSSGIKVPFVDPKRSILGFRDALMQIIKNPNLVEQLSTGALRKAAELSWDAKVLEISEAYARGRN
jgi:glycosyltransferase involved in cell wall biosynthesis